MNTISAVRRNGNIPQFWILIVIYFGYIFPVLLKHVYDINGGGIEIFALKSNAAALWYFGIWMMALVPLYIGFGHPGKTVAFNLPRHIDGALRLILIVLAPVYILAKTLLAKDGVYNSYAFDSDLMVGGVWSFSMFLSETLVLVFTAALLANKRIIAWACFLLISINLLHGTRIFTFVSIMIFASWYVTDQKFTKKIILKLIASFITLMIAALIVFLYRSNVDFFAASIDQQLFYVFSPVVYESVFSQTSLLDLANAAFSTSTCDASDFSSDFFSFIIPRILNEGKDAICLGRYSYMQPLGAFNGIFATYIYFGWWYFIYFFAYGLVFRFLRSRKHSSYYFNIIYFYALANISMRILRDGPILSGKYFANACMLVLMIYLVEKSMPYLMFKSNNSSRLSHY